jgi:alpha-beta hydrolase superfamily lysophospholipase
MPFLHSLSCTLKTWLRPRRLPRIAAMVVVASLTAAGCAQLAVKERELTFRIEPGTARWYNGLPDGLHETHIAIDDKGNPGRIHTWWWPAEQANAPALLYLHGARWNLTGHLFRIAQLRELGFSVLAIDYRGFGQSGGELPSEETVYVDAKAGWAHLAQLQPDPARRFIYGHSLGGAVAVELAAGLAPDMAGGLIIEATFTSLADVARSLSYSWLPLQLVMSQRFDSISKIGRVGLPVLIVHGSADRVVAPHFSETLYRAAAEPKRLVMIEGGSHNNSMRLGQEAYREAMRALFPSVAASIR